MTCFSHQMTLENWPVVSAASWVSFLAGNLTFLDELTIKENQMLFCDRSFLSLIAKFYEGAEEMAVRMWAQKLVNPVQNGVKLAPTPQ